MDTIPATFNMRLNRVGVVGHRHFEFEQAIQDSLHFVLKNIVTVFKRAAIESKSVSCTPQLQLLTPLAEGADRLGAKQALSLGYSLHAVLPFPACEYELDFPAQASRLQFRDLLSKATTVNVLIGSRASLESRHAAYQAAACWLLANIDILIAVWDGEPQTRPGSTGRTVTEAHDMGIPVVWIESHKPDKINFFITANSTLSTHTELQVKALKTLETLISLR